MTVYSKYAFLMATDAPTRLRPLDWSANIACLAPAQVIRYANRHTQAPRHHFNDPAWIVGVDLTPRVDRELLRIRGRYAYAAPGMEIN